MRLDWDELAARALARQFPTESRGVPALLDQVGPIQSQTARSPFLALAARGGVDHAALTAAYEDAEVVRGSTLRGTVHTATATQHRVLDTAARVGQRVYWLRQLGLERATPEDLWDSLEAYATDAWRTPDQLRTRLDDWLIEQGEDPGRLHPHTGRYLAIGHGGLVRRPLKGGWEGQSAPGYRSAAEVTGQPRPAREAALDDLVRLHLRSHGPSSREDIAWWSGLPARTVDEVVERLSGLIQYDGPLDRAYLDLPDAPGPRDLPGVRLLPEFDALLCAYDSKARDRFVTRDHHDALWSPANGLLLPPLLVDGRITGFWRATGSAKRRPMEVTWFAGTRRPRKAELAEAVARVEAALGVTITELTLTRASA